MGGKLLQFSKTCITSERNGKSISNAVERKYWPITIKLCGVDATQEKLAQKEKIFACLRKTAIWQNHQACGILKNYLRGFRVRELNPGHLRDRQIY